MAKVICVLYDDPVDGYPQSYARDERSHDLKRYPDGQTTADAQRRLISRQGSLLGSVSGELGLRKYLEGLGPYAGRDFRQGWRGLRA